MTDRVYLFKEGYAAFGSSGEKMREILGGKGAGLAEMTAAEIPVPPGMTITTDVCREYYEGKKKLPESLLKEIQAKLYVIESILDKRLGDYRSPLLLSVRSGSKFSMPGMMDTILNLGLNDKIVDSLASITGNPRFAWDSYRRFIQMYGNVVLEIPKDAFEHAISQKKAALGVTLDTELSTDALSDLASTFKNIVEDQAKIPFPSDPKVQLMGAVEAVFRSWNNPRAIYYRNLNKIDHNLGTAVTIQSMVFGNFDDKSATGVCFTRNPSTGEKALYGEYLVNAQGEDVVAGTRTPRKITEMGKDFPSVYKELETTVARLEKHYRDMQDIEFTVQEGKLFLLQTRTGKRTAASAVKIAVEMKHEGILTHGEALMRVSPNQLTQLLLPSFTEVEKEKARKAGRRLAVGLNASPGAAIGEIVFDSSESETLGSQGKKVILCRIETCPDDLPGIVPAQGVLTSRGGMTSHAAVVARGMGKPCVAGCEAVRIDLEKEEMLIDGILLRKGDVISIDGSTGEVFKGEIPTHEPSFGTEFGELLSWADKTRRLKIRTNSDTPEDSVRARTFGAEGIGLCRTEHMFMSPERLGVVQSMIMSSDKEDRRDALAKLLPMQREDFLGIFRAMDGLPVTIRLLDPPLHEFLPKLEDLIADVVTLRTRGVTGKELRDKEILLARVRTLHESNPMMGLRGCRLGLMYPEINEMQVQAIFEAAVKAVGQGIKVLPEVMIPLIGLAKELEIIRGELERVAIKVMEQEKVTIEYKFGTMIEIPRACVTSEDIAEHAEFFSFGTNDLTQMTFGYSRDDAEGKFLQKYLEGVETEEGPQKVLLDNPFERLDLKGVGKLMEFAVEGGRKRRPDLKIGICGEHGGDPSSIHFAHKIGLDYVSCSPYRVPIARLAAAQAALANI